MIQVIAIVAMILSLLTIIIGIFVSFQLIKKASTNEKTIHEMAASIEDMKAELATAKAMMFAYEAKLKGEQGLWCLEHEGNKKWYAPGILLRTESANGENETEFSYDQSNGNVGAISRSRGKLVSSITFSKSGAPVSGKV